MLPKYWFLLFSTLFLLSSEIATGKTSVNTSKYYHVVEDEFINSKILNLYEYLRTLELKDEVQVKLDNDTLRDFQSFGQFFETSKEHFLVAASCTVCYAFVGSVALQARQLDTSEATVEGRVKLLCPLFTSYTTTEVCNGLIARVIPTMFYVLKNRPDLSVISFCGYVFQQLGCNTDDPYFEWSVELDQTPKRVTTRPDPEAVPELSSRMKTAIVAQKARQNEPAASNPNLVKIIQLADIHIDPQYVANAQAVCKNNVLCCRKSSEARPFVTGGSAGEFADNRKCDPPLSFLELSLKHIARQHKDVKLFYMSGDIVPHTIWSSSISENSEVIEECSKLIYKYFPNTKVLILVGNHEAHPVNLFSPPGVPPELDTRWLYNVSYDAWKKSIPSDQVSSYFEEGSYTVDISKRLKVVVLNSNVCYGFNMWGAYVPKDQGGLLNWLIQELDKSESKGQNVHILGHVPPGHPDCAKVWSRNFYNIISRYRKTVKGQFYGHTHYDEMKLFYSPTELGVPINAGWISPSLTPYETNNPSYKVFYADGGSKEDEATWDILDYETWIMNLDEANKSPKAEPKWYPLYRATTTYNIPNTRVENLGIFINNMATNKTLFDQFYQHFYKATPEQRQESSTYRQKQILCGIVRPYFRDEKECERIQTAVDGRVESIPVYSNYYFMD